MAPCVTSGSPHPTTSERSSWSLLQARLYLLNLVPHHGTPRFSPSLILPTSLKGAGIENFKVTNRGSYFLRFSGTAGCAVSSLLLFAPFSCLFLQTNILSFSTTWRKVLSQPGPASPPSSSSWASPCLCSHPLRHYECTLQLDAF